MIIYWIMYAFPSLFGIIEQAPDRSKPRFTFPWMIMSIALVLIIGLRWETGGDWGNYRDMVTDFYWNRSLGNGLSDPAFNILLMIAARTSAGILIVTITSGLLMAYALTRFCLAQPRPWLAMTVSIPFMVVIMGMGYIRQGMAISFLMLGILSLERGSLLRFIGYLVIGATFHSTAVVLVPFAGLVGSRYRYLTVAMGALLTLGLAASLLFSRIDEFQSGYVAEGMSSSGAAIRLFMTSLASVLFLLFNKKFGLSSRDLGFWRAFSFVPILLLLILPFFSSSTVLDRLGLYFLPIQTFVAGRLPDALGQTQRSRYLISIAVVLLYGLAFFIWLNFAVNVAAWLPYRSYLLEDGICLQC